MSPIIISFSLRPRNSGSFFASYRECLNLLFQSANLAVTEWCKQQGFVPGVVEVLHTFGSTLNFHPHIHMLLSEGGSDGDTGFDFSVWRQCGFFPERVLKERFKYFLVKSLRGFAAKKVKEKIWNIPNELKELWQRKLKCRDFYTATVRLYKVIWYVYIGEKLPNAHFTTRYIGRYAKRPCLSETKILYYSFEEQIVVISYHDKITGTDKRITLPVEEFLIRLIRHIPEKNFRMIRYYGIYANRVRTETTKLLIPQIIALFGLAELTYEPAKTWRERMLEYSGVDPLICPKCRIEMELLSVTYPSRAGPLKTVYFR
jgi:Putative transposase